MRYLSTIQLTEIQGLSGDQTAQNHFACARADETDSKRLHPEHEIVNHNNSRGHQRLILISLGV
jgi:hypothetical protein